MNLSIINNMMIRIKKNHLLKNNKYFNQFKMNKTIKIRELI